MYIQYFILFNMIQEKHCKVVMLPGIQRYLNHGEIYKWEDKLYIWKNTTSLRNDRPQYLYFTSNDEIKEGDWYLFKIGKELFIAKASLIKSSTIDGIIKQDCLKVIASTDSSLGLPAIPEFFLKQYVAANGAITDVILESYENNRVGLYEQALNRKFGSEYNGLLKLTDKNEVIIVEKLVSIKPTEFDVKIHQATHNTTVGIEPTFQSKYMRNEDKALEDAAKHAIEQVKQEIPNLLSLTFPYKAMDTMFEKGVNWQKEQSANDVIEFTKWHETYKSTIKLNDNRPIEELYRVWKNSR